MAPPKQHMIRGTPKLSAAVAKGNQDSGSDFEEDDFEQPRELNEVFSTRCFSKHGFDFLLLSASGPSSLPANRDSTTHAPPGLSNKRAQQVYQAREQEFLYSGLV